MTYSPTTTEQRTPTLSAGTLSAGGPNAIDARCSHCDLPIPRSARRFVRAGLIDGVETPRFCCSGCDYVYHAIQQLGLSDFYRYRANAAGVRPPNPVTTAGAFAFLDDPENINRCTIDLAPELRRVVFVLEGIHCAGCVWILEKLSRANPGILSSRLDFSSGELELLFNPQLTELSAIAWLLQRLGYRGVPIPTERSAYPRLGIDRRSLTQIAVAGFCAANTMMLAVALIQGLFTGIDASIAAYFRWISLAIAAPAVLYSAQPFYRSSWGALRSGHFHLDLPLSIAIITGFGVSVWNTIIGADYVYYDSVTALIFFLLIGRYVQRRATQRALRDSRNAWNLLPMMVERRNADGVLEAIPASRLQLGDVVTVRAGDRIPVDGTVTTGCSTIDASILTGESTPIELTTGSAVQAGTLNILAEIELRVEVLGSQTRMGRLLEEVKRRGGARAPILQFTNRISGYFLAGVFSLTVMTFFVWLPQGLNVALENSLALLIVSCPCALGIATPVALSVAMGKAARSGLLIKGEDVIERLANTEVIFIDKTGTVTEGSLTVAEVHRLNGSAGGIAPLVHAIATTAAPHPVILALRRWAEDEIAGDAPIDLTPMLVAHALGRGLTAESPDGNRYQLGSSRWFAELGIALPNEVLFLQQQLAARGLSVVLLTANDEPKLLFALLDSPRIDAVASLRTLEALGKELHLLSGDLQSIVSNIGAELGIPEARCHGGRFPEDKERLVHSETRFKAVVGDGVNDIAAMSVADVALGLRGEAEVLSEVADIIVTRGAIGAVTQAFVGAARTMAIVRRNLILSLVYNSIGAMFAVAGSVNPLVAALLMPVSSLTVIALATCSKTFESPQRARA